VALPRGEALGRAASVYLEAAIGPDEALQQAALHRWTLDRGLALMLPGRPLGPLEELLHLRDLKLEPASLQLLETLQNFSSERPWANSDSEASSSAKEGLLSGLARSQVAATKALAAVTQGSVATQTQSVFPGMNLSLLTPQALAEQRSKYVENDHVIYTQNFFDEQTWSAILKETKRLWMSEDLEANCNLDGVDRLGGYVLDHLAEDSSLYQLIYGNEHFRKWVSAVNGEGQMFPSDFPIEIREYGRRSRGMACHSDLQMYAFEKKDIEFAVTVDNDSQCNVSFWDAKGQRHEVQTTGNSVMMVRSNAARHCVSSTVGGSRTILKFIYVGDYRKSNDFWRYTGNYCSENAPNVKALRLRRERLLRGEQEREGGLEL